MFQRWPTLFVSHGAPTFALEPGVAGARLEALGQELPRPAAVLVVSPHWMSVSPQVTTSLRPRTLHDFSGFDPALYQISYPAPGHPQLANRAIGLLQTAGWSAEADATRGLDHGAWVPLRHLFPDARTPVIQVSMPTRLDATSAFEFGRALSPLTGEGVLIVGSGSLTHNLHEFRHVQDRAESYAEEFARWIRDAVIAGDHDRLVRAMEVAPHAQRAHPTIEHYLPLLIAAGASPAPLPVTVLEGGLTHGVLAMDSFLFGPLFGAGSGDSGIRENGAGR
jgi:4,5-DOPA dioxygenase extradiol